MSHEAQLEYLRRIDSVLLALRGLLSAEEMAEVRHLVDHGEPAEGLCTLAWIIQNKQKPVPMDMRRTISELTGGLIDETHMPESFRGLASP